MEALRAFSAVEVIAIQCFPSAVTHLGAHRSDSIITGLRELRLHGKAQRITDFAGEIRVSREQLQELL